MGTMRAFFITNPVSIRYLTGFTGASNTEREAYVLMIDEELYLFTSSLYTESARLHSSLLPVTVIEISARNPISRKLKERVDYHKIRTLAFEESNLTVRELTMLKRELSGIRFIPSNDVIENRRMVKRADEMEAIRKAAEYTDQCFTHVLRRIKPGVTEARLAWEIEGFLRYRAGGIAFDPIIAFNEHSSLPHYLNRGNDPLRSGSLVLLDFGARVNGYCADMTRVVFLGTPEPKWVRTYDATLKAHDTALALLAAGERNGSTLDAASQHVIRDAGFTPYTHSLGHAVGLEIHEAPRLSIHKEDHLVSDMAVTIEPGIYVEGSFGIRIEDLVRVRNKGIERLSNSPTQLTVL